MDKSKSSSKDAKGTAKKVFDTENVPEARVRYIDIDDEKKDFSILVAKSAYAGREKGDLVHYKDAAELIKREFDEKYGPAWHVVVGPNFGSFVTHEFKNIIYFFIGNMGVLLWKHG